MSEDRKVPLAIFKEAGDTVSKKRPGVHGSAENSFEMIGDLWGVYLNHTRKVRGNDRILPQDVAQMMSMLKKCRAVYGDVANVDNFVDDVGYTGLAAMLQLPAAKPIPETPKARKLTVRTCRGPRWRKKNAV